MDYSIRHSFVLATVLVLSGFSGGCTTIVTPLSTADTVPTDGNHGLLIGNMQLAWHGADKSKGLKQPLDMKWSIEEETRGKYFTIANLPTSGPFVVQLPAGSYRVKGISFDGIWGTWHTVLPTAFQIQSGGCTSLGTWELQRETESFADWITGHVFKHSEPTQAELHPALATRDCSIRAASSESSVRTKLGFQNRQGGFEF
ncbi:MAG: hypothetical protein U0236_03735 [Nitrospira sp.]